MGVISNIYIKTVLLVAVLILVSSCREVVIEVDNLPGNTPPGAPIYITGNFNYWDPGDANYQLKQTADSTYIISLPKVFGKIEYKFTRGDWTTVEKNKCGIDISNRIGYNNNGDTIINSIESWSDLDPINCDSVTIVITEIPLNTPKDEQIKIAGNFNAWNPGNDSSYVLKQDKESQQLTVTIPIDSGKKVDDVLYKIVRGNELKSEADEFGQPIEKRKLLISKEGKVKISIDSWEDLENRRLNSVTIILTDIPENTPKSSSLYLVGNFNGWIPDDDKYKFEALENGQYSITIPRLKYGLSFKITRGSWRTEAANRYGEKLNNRDYNYDDIDTLYLSVDNWFDSPVKPINTFTIVLTEIPENTPEGSTIYLASSLNNWDAQDKDYKFTKTDTNTYLYSLSTKERWISFKITRGGWETEAADRWGEKLNNRDFEFTGNDTLFLKVENWFDLY